MALHAALTAHAQLIPSGQPLPDTGKPPVVFLNGYQSGCRDRPTFAGTFGVADQLLQQQDTRVSLLFNNCDVPNNPAIEALGNAFGEYLNALRYTDGRPVPEVDVVAHSMGGLILRSYLAGKQATRGVFQPPPDVKIRKAVFIAVPFFGSFLTEFAGTIPGYDLDTQTRQLRPGDAFIFDLATWNQGRDDLRGIDAVAVVTNGGTGGVPGILPLRERFQDSTVTLTSASLEGIVNNRTRIINGYCHTELSGLLALGCTNPSRSVARMTGADHDTARIMLSFLRGTNDWQTIGVAPAQNEFLRERSGLLIELRDNNDAVVPISSAAPDLRVRNNNVVWTDYLVAPQSPYSTALTLAGGGTANVRISAIAPGSTQVFTAYTGGPVISAVIPNFGDTSPRAVAPGSFISVYGAALATREETAGTVPYPQSLAGTNLDLNATPIGLQYAGPTQINALVPDTASGLVKLTVRNSNGRRTWNVLVEPAVPSLYGSAVNALTGGLVTAASPIRPGEYLTLYGTGLGLTERRADGLEWARQQPTVSVGGQPCAVTYAGRSPGYLGLDQINCQLSAALQPSDTTAVVVTSGRRSATINIPVR